MDAGRSRAVPGRFRASVVVPSHPLGPDGFAARTVSVAEPPAGQGFRDLDHFVPAQKDCCFTQDCHVVCRP